MEYSNRFRQFSPEVEDSAAWVNWDRESNFPKKSRYYPITLETIPMTKEPITKLDEHTLQKYLPRLRLSLENISRQVWGLPPVVRLPEEEVIDHEP